MKSFISKFGHGVTTQELGALRDNIAALAALVALAALATVAALAALATLASLTALAFDRSYNRSCESNMLIGSSPHKTSLFAIQLQFTLCMHMHRSTLVHTYIYIR